MKKDHKKLFDQVQRIYCLITEGEYEEALVTLRHLQRKGRKSKLVKFNKVGLLIDIGTGLKDQKLILEGIDAGKDLLKVDLNNNNKKSLYYNLANGYMALFKIDFSGSKNIKKIIENKELREAKKWLKKSAEESHNLPVKQRLQRWTNYANCLDSLGRGLEALDAYDEVLKLDPNFAMAIGNKGLALRFFADVSGKYYRAAMYIESYQLLKAAIENEDLVKEGCLSAKNEFEEEMRKIEMKFKDTSVLSGSIAHPKYDKSGMSSFEEFYIDFCSANRLFLNLHVHVEDCEASILDPVFISIITPVDDNETFYRLAKYINQIKEDYAVARLLLAQSQFQRNDFDRISRRTTFVNTLDYSDFNIYVGLLKSAFSEAYSIFDKISRFISQYLDLDCKDEKNLYFRDIWKVRNEDNKMVIRPEIIDSKNISLYALYDIYLDFQGEEYQIISRIRNSSEHERLIIHSSQWNGQEDKNNIRYDSMLSETLRLFQLGRAAVIYLINFVQMREMRKKQDTPGLVPEIIVDTLQSF
jgi:tetratricopeptide (TPR) repeat protein